MKKMMVICLMATVMFVGTTFGNGSPTQTANQTSDIKNNQIMIGGPGSSNASAEGGEASAGANAGAYSGIYWDYSPTSIIRYPEYNVGQVNPGYPQPPWWMPGVPQIALWNAAAADLRFYEGQWTRKQVEDALKKSGKWFTECGAGFKWFITLKSYGNKPTSTIELKLVQNAPFEIIQKDYTFLGDIPVIGSKDMGQCLTLMWALKLAMDNGADMAILNPGMNVVYQGNNFSPGLGVGTAGVHNSFSVISGLASTEAKAAAEPVVKLAVFESNGTGIVLKAPEERKEKKEEKIEEKGKEIQGVPVSPEILSMAGLKKETKEIKETEKEKNREEEVTPMMRNIWRRAAGG